MAAWLPSPTVQSSAPRPRVLEPRAWQASSTSTAPAVSASWAKAGRAQTSPRRCTGSTAATRRSPALASAASSVSGVITPVSGSTSANTTSAPT